MATPIICPNCGHPRTIVENFCGNCGYQFGGSQATNPIAFIGNPQQAPITRVFNPIDTLIAKTLPIPSPLPPSSHQRNKVRTIVLAVLALILIVAVVIGVQIGRFTTLGASNSIANNSPQSGTVPANSNTANVLTATPSPTATPTPTPSPSPTPCPRPCILYQENGSDGWQGWTFSSDNASWEVVTNGLLVSVVSHRMAPGDGLTAIAPYTIDTTSFPNFEVQAVIVRPSLITA